MFFSQCIFCLNVTRYRTAVTSLMPECCTRNNKTEIQQRRRLRKSKNTFYKTRYAACKAQLKV